MRLPDVFVTSKQFFGYLLPGAIWIASIFVLVSGQSPLMLLEEKSTPVLLLEALVALYFGVATRGVSSKACEFATKSLYRRRLPAECAEFWRDHNVQYMTVPPELSSAVVKILKGLPYVPKDILRSLPSVRLGNTAEQDSSAYARRARFCRDLATESSPPQERLVRSLQVDINLLLSTPLPLVIFGILIFVKRGTLPDPFGHSQTIVWTISSVVSVVIAGLLAWQVPRRRRVEAEAWYWMVLALGALGKFRDLPHRDAEGGRHGVD